jgi:glutaminyl-tRNA synthetase
MWGRALTFFFSPPSPCALPLPAPPQPVELLCEYDHERNPSFPAGGAKVKGNLHWVCGAGPGAEPLTAEVRLYDYLFTTDDPGSTGDWETELNPASEVVLTGCVVDASLAATAGPGAVKLRDRFQFERLGYFVADQDSVFADAAAGGAPKLVFNQTVSLKEAADAKKVRATK